MAVLTIKNLPKDTYEALRAQAKAHRRSIVAEAQVLLERAVGTRPVDEEELRSRLEELRKKTAFHLTDDFVRAAIDEGRK